MHEVRKVKNYLIAGAIILFVLLPLILDRYFIHILILSGIYIILALGLSIASGFTGQLSMGQAAFYGIGAYVSALVAVNNSWPFWVVMPIAVVVTGLAGVLVGVPSLRLSGPYLSISTVGLGEIVRLVLLNWIPVTRGPMGVGGIPAPAIGSFVFNTPFRYYYLVLAAVILSTFIVHRIVTSRVGLAFMSIADVEIAAQAVGVNNVYYKTLAFILSAAFAGFGGSLYAHYITYIHPDAFAFTESVAIVTIIILGGVRSLPGIMMCGLLLTFSMEYLRAFDDYRMIIYGVVLLFGLIFAPDGIGGMLDRLSRKMDKAETSQPVGST